jgi:hypothetical protein
LNSIENSETSRAKPREPRERRNGQEALIANGGQIEMKRSENRKEQTVGLQKAALQKIDSAMVGPQKTHEQLVDELTTIMTEATGTQHSDVADRIINQVINAQVCPRPRDGDHLTKAISMIREMAPQNVTEAMLAVQMIATNDAALMFLGRATTEGQSSAGAEASALCAIRLMRLHLDQIEAMQKLKGKTRHQKVVVEHVHVYQGGQAIVGAVSAVKGETRREQAIVGAIGAVKNEISGEGD